MTPVIAATIIFIIAALLWYQAVSSSLEPFRDLPPLRRPYYPATVCNGPGGEAEAEYGVEGECDRKWFVPGDLARAPKTGAVQPVPTSLNRPIASPGPGTSPPKPVATQKELDELDVQINIWLAAADQRENQNPGSLTADQRQERVMLQGRLANIRDQTISGMITDSYELVTTETMRLRTQNAGWQQQLPNIEALYSFGKGLPQSAFLTTETYAKFRGLFNAALNELKGHIQPTPIQRVRVQQLEIMAADLRSAEAQFAGLPPIRVGAAALYLQQMLKPDQPLPTLFAMEPPVIALLAASPTDVQNDINSIRWRFTMSNQPEPSILQTLMSALQGSPSPAVVEEVRSRVAGLKNSEGPSGLSGSGRGSGLSVSGHRHNDKVTRATTLCKQIREAFPQDSAALGCPSVDPENSIEAETVINTVCSRLRYSVPTVDPTQFGCS